MIIKKRYPLIAKVAVLGVKQQNVIVNVMILYENIIQERTAGEQKMTIKKKLFCPKCNAVCYTDLDVNTRKMIYMCNYCGEVKIEKSRKAAGGSKSVKATSDSKPNVSLFGEPLLETLTIIIEAQELFGNVNGVATLSRKIKDMIIDAMERSDNVFLEEINKSGKMMFTIGDACRAFKNTQRRCFGKVK